jgi:predicted MFS family arabinose efflux permease
VAFWDFISQATLRVRSINRYLSIFCRLADFEFTEGATFADITALMTYPTMFMGVGNLICMPLALAIGRRPVYLASCLILVLGGVLAANSKDYEMHLGVRMLLGIGAGNSEALVPMM